ncbi:hypothetical protein AB0D34_31795 [Streptomyces sp. NPDC048420]|uniref:hypothetical protein n=1 Tax=Streptomyces sp. NPDC048420 TaxID=3155755 RepID=UPI003431CF6C
MRTLLESELELDEPGLSLERGPGEASAVIGDKDIRLLLRETRIALAKAATTRISTDDDSTVGYDIPLTCVIHAHPRCRVRYSRLGVDFSPTAGAVISDMAPREVLSEHPVEITTTVRAGLTFAVAADVLGGELGSEQSRLRTVYHPKIVASGIGFTRGYWDFLADGDRYLHSNRELRLLVTAPPNTPLVARFQLRAQVKLDGLPGLLPLLARNGSIDATHRLD